MFRTMVQTKAGRQAGVVLLLIGVVVGAAGAQTVSALLLSEQISSGLFRVKDGEVVEFNVSLVDRAPAPNGTVTLRLVDPAGGVVARRSFTLAPGQSATLRHATPGRFRAEAEVAEPSGAILSDRRVVSSTVEISRVDDFLGGRFVCGPGDHIFFPGK